MVSDLVMVTPPKPPGSRQLISPPLAVFEIAPAKVLHGAVRLHGLASSPTPDTHVRVAWPKAAVGTASAPIASARTMADRREVNMLPSLTRHPVPTQCLYKTRHLRAIGQPMGDCPPARGAPSTRWRLSPRSGAF